MKVLFVSNDPSIFDEHSQTRARMREYAALIGELHIVSPAPRSAEETTEGALILHPLHGMRLQVLLELPRTVRSLITTYGIEVVSSQDAFEYGFAAMKAVQGTPAKLHIQVHTDFLSPWFVRGAIFRSPRMHIPLMNHVRRHLAEKVLPKADSIRTVSKRVRDSLITFYGNRIPAPSVIPIAVGKVVPAAAALPPHDFSFVLITVSRLEPEKRIEDILYALARLGYQHKSVGLIIVGEGSERGRLERLVRHLGLKDRVVFAGWQENDAWGMMRSANAYIQASAYEGYGRTLLEAALAQIPIITTDVGIVGDVFTGYQEVLSAPVGDPAALATHILGLVEDHQARKIFTMNAELAATEHLKNVGDLPMAIRDDLAEVLSKG